MNELTTTSRELPGTLPELSKFVLVGREKLTAVRAEIRAIEKVGLAKEVHEQKLAEAQAIAEAVLDAEVKIGELTAAMPKASGGDRRSEGFKMCTADDFEKPKRQALAEIGLTQSQARRYEMLAKNPQIVQQAKESARRTNDIVNRSNVIKAIVASSPKRPDPVVVAKEQHEAFQTKKRESVVNFADIQNDKANQELINLDLHHELLGTLGKINTFIIEHTAHEITEMSRSLSDEDRASLISFCNWIHSKVLEIANAIILD